MSNPSSEWDSDERNKQNDLRKYLDSLTRQKQQLIKGIKSKNTRDYLQLEEDDFKNMLQDSLTLTELRRLSPEEIQFRDKLIEEIMSVWRRHVEDIKAFQNEERKESEYYDEKATKGWMPKHHDLEPLESGEYKKRKLSVSQAARIHEAKDVTARGILSGVQPLRKMYKGISVQCMKCNEVWSRQFEKPELSPWFEEGIKTCPICKSRKWLRIPTYDKINAVVAELKDENTFSEIDPIRIIVFGDDEPASDNTLDIERHLGEPIEVTGDIYSVDISKNQRDSKIVVFLYVKYLVDYVAKKDVQLTVEDMKAIMRFVNHVGPDSVVDKLTEMFATSVIGHNSVKKGLLLCATSTSIDKKTKKLHTILVGDVGLAKSELLKNSVEIVPGSRYENIQFSTGKSLTAIVSKDEGDAITLRTGPIPQAKGAIAALNEIGKMSHDDQGFLYDVMQEQEFSTNKLGRWFHIDSPTAIVASGNPIGGSWKSEYNTNDDDIRIDIDKIPTVKPLLDRFDLIFIFKDDRSERGLTDYALKKSEMEIRPRPDYIAYIQKHILYAKQRNSKPMLSEEARTMLNQYYVGVRKRYGSPRIMNTIQRIAQTIASLKLKDTIDEVDAKETMTFYNVILQQVDMIVALPSSPRDVTYQECLDILMESAFPYSFEELVKKVCESNQHVATYIGKSFKLQDNKKLRVVLDMLRNHSRIKVTQEKPIVLQCMVKAKADKQAYDLYDLYDHTFDTSAQNLDEKNIPERNELQKKVFETFDGVSEGRSYRSYRSDSTEDKSAKIERYNRLSAQSRRNWNAASHVRTDINDSK
jgi:DNA replicative helicase MCM subunit Mcm2 (Cdc46/Mcm family)